MSIDYSREKFENRHIGPDKSETREMLNLIKSPDLGSLIKEAIPKGIRLNQEMTLPPALSEKEYLEDLKKKASGNKIYNSFIGLGYYGTELPNVIKRNVLENPGWYTAYTPYQAEISQGRMEALINFQTVITELTRMPLANASLLDEATAAAEAMSMLYDSRKGEKRKNGDTFFVSGKCFPQTIEVLKNRAEPLGINIRTGNPDEIDAADPSLFGVLIQYPGSDGDFNDYTKLVQKLHDHNVYSAFAADLLSLTLLKSPGSMGADVVVGSSQRFGVPMGYGGPHAGYFAAREEFQRRIPGRIIGITKDAEGNPAVRMALQTREQHIRREKATSNICTAQVLLAVIAGFYAVYHGPKGLRKIASRINGLAGMAENGLKKSGYKIQNSRYFDTITVQPGDKSLVPVIRKKALEREMNFRYNSDNTISISFDETHTPGDVESVLETFSGVLNTSLKADIETLIKQEPNGIPAELKRGQDYLNQDVFNRYRTEHEMLRYLKMLENRDLDLTHSMISLGSCTMKLNATAEMIPITWPEFSNLHPFAPADQAKGYRILFDELTGWLKEITGFDAVSLQPNSGAQGEYTGLMTIRAYHHDHGEKHRNVTIIPSSAHGTNPASAVMAGMKVVVTKCDENGNIDIDDLTGKVQKHKENLAALMITYPSTHGVFEENIKEICKIVHDNGGLVYMDGANMNAQVGLTNPAIIVADVCHLNLHKTFCIPHGGGGPGMGPIGVVEKLKPYLPGHPFSESGNGKLMKPVAAAPFGSAGILPISHAYIRMMGAVGLKRASEYAILNANYIKDRLNDHYPVLYTGKTGRSAHEFIIDLRVFKQSAGIEAADVAKRLMDYSVHAPTMSFPVPGTLMIEPTESESKAELDRFCEAMISIREEIREIEQGLVQRDNNVLKHAPHTTRVLMCENWDRPYTREKAAFPADYLRFNKFWPSVSRVDDAYGDRNLMCTCAPLEDYEENPEPAIV